MLIYLSECALGTFFSNRKEKHVKQVFYSTDVWWIDFCWCNKLYHNVRRVSACKTEITISLAEVCNVIVCQVDACWYCLLTCNLNSLTEFSRRSLIVYYRLSPPPHSVTITCYIQSCYFIHIYTVVKRS